MNKYVDKPAIIQVIGNIYNNPKLLDMADKYSFNEEDFPEEFHRILFGAIYNLHLLGAKEININTITDYLQQRPKKLAIYESNKGAEYLTRISQNAQIAAFDYYYQRMKKMTLLRMYNQQAGLDLAWLYDIDNIFDVKKRQAQEDWLDNTPIEEIANTIDQKISSIRIKYIDNTDTSIVNAGTGAEELLKELQRMPEVGYPLYGPIINTITRGARLKKLYLRSASTGTGKALPNSTIIPTPNGDKRVEDIKVGDYLFDAFGEPTLVQAVYPQGKKEVWEVTFKDGRTAKCCEEHLWSYCTIGQRAASKEQRQFYTSTLKEISEKELYTKASGYKILVPMQKAVQYPKKDYYVKPYTFGLLLGDGSFRYTKNQKALTFSSENEELPNAISKEMNWDVKKNSDYNYNWIFKWIDGESQHTNVWVEEILKDHPELWNVKSEGKFIPIEYLEGSVDQRLDLLNGLLDSDGSVDPIKGRVSFYTISPYLKDDVIKLARSLGFKTSVTEDKHKATNLCYKIEIIGNAEDKIKLFKLKRKKELILKWYNNGKRKENNLFNPIVKIEKLNYSEEMTCFYVDNEEHLFLMNDYIVTHNTRSMIADACFIACDEMFDNEANKWIKNGTKEPTLFISTEQDLSEVQTMMIAFLSNVNEEHVLYGNYLAGEWERVVRAAQILKDSPIYTIRLSDFSLQDIENTIKYAIREHHIKYVCFDYLHSSMKILEEISSRARVQGLREDNILFMIATRLKDLCNEYGIFIETATQLNGGYQDAKVYDQNLLRGAKSIADRIDLGMIMLDVTQDDREALADIVSKGFEMPVIKISIYKNRRGRYKDILLWCKCNRGVCKIEPMFATNYSYELIEIEDLKIKVKPSIESSAF